MLSKSIESLKRDAKRLKKAENIPHHEALERIAKREGFASWKQLLDEAKGNL